MDAENITIEGNSTKKDLIVENVNETEHNLSTNENFQQIEVEANPQTQKMEEGSTQVENMEKVQRSEEKVVPEIIENQQTKEANTDNSTEADPKMEEETTQVENTEKVQKSEEKVVPEIIENLETKEADTKMEEEVTQVENMEKVKTNEKIIETQFPKAQGMGLNMIAQYDSDADDTEQETGNETVPYRQQAVHVNSDTDSDSDSSTDESTCSEGHFSLKKEKQDLEKMLSDGSDDDDEDNKSTRQRRQPKVKGELLLEDLPPIEDLYITVPEDECVELGKVQSIVDQLVLVSVLPNSLLVDLDTVLFLNKGRKVLGEVFDVLGQISEPLYCVRFNSNEQIKEKNINIGDVVYVAPKTEYTQFIILSNLMKVRGSDASWENDVEPPPRFIDYSDDEEERQARARARNKDRRMEAEHTVQQKRAMNEDTDNDSVASFDTRPAYRRHNAHGAGTSRGRGRGMYNQGYNMPHAGSWHSNYFQGPPPPQQQQQMFYSPYPMHMMPPNMAYPPPPPPPPGSSQYDNNNM